MTTMSPAARLDQLLGNERRRNATSWVGDAIYGVNDGLGAIFGIISGVAGYTSESHTILVSGFFGALASTLSMGAGAWLATKSENELMERSLLDVEKSIQKQPEREIEILTFIYQEKGFSEEDASYITSHIASDKHMFLRTMAQEKHGIREAGYGSPWISALVGSVSTFVGAIVPLIPFFFVQGLPAIITAAVISLLAHFVVGAAKSKVTVRTWWASGIEMTIAGVIVGIVSYALGVLGSHIL